jgi:Flp pilus assembly protein TadD
VILATMIPALASPVANCNGTISNPTALIQECTTHLSTTARGRVPEPWMYFNRGLAFKMLGRLEEAYLNYSKAIALNPTFAAAYTNRGNVRLLRNDTAGALVDFQTAIELDPSDDVARENLNAIEEALRKVGGDKSGRDAAAVPAR